jgi:hypothetical protein
LSRDVYTASSNCGILAIGKVGFRRYDFVLSHPCGKNKYAARMGHPLWHENRRLEAQFMVRDP